MAKIHGVIAIGDAIYDEHAALSRHEGGGSRSTLARFNHEGTYHSCYRITQAADVDRRGVLWVDAIVTTRRF